VHRLWPETPVVPILLGRTTLEEQAGLARALRNVLDEDTLLVVTATFTHFGDDGPEDPFPIAGTRADIEGALAKFEQPILDAVLARDGPGFAMEQELHPGGGCGYNAVMVGLLALAQGAPGVVLAKGTSLETLQDPVAPSGVSYLGLAYPGRWPSVPTLSDDDRLTLSRITEENVVAAINGREAPVLPALSPRLKQRGGAFVTITRHGDLKGCMGRLEAESVGQAVAQAAKMAAASDPRFHPLRPDDLPTLELEISVMGPFQKLEDAEDFVPGRHGLLLTRGFNRGLLLPQVASKYRLGREAFLDALAEKAGLPCDGWKDATLERFGVDAFHTRPVRSDR